MTEAQKQKFIELSENGHFKNVREKIFWIIKNYPGITTDEIQSVAGIKRNGTIGGRLAELQDAGSIQGLGKQKTEWFAVTNFVTSAVLINERLNKKIERAVKTLEKNGVPEKYKERVKKLL